MIEWTEREIEGQPAADADHNGVHIHVSRYGPDTRQEGKWYWSACSPGCHKSNIATSREEAQFLVETIANGGPEAVKRYRANRLLREINERITEMSRLELAGIDISQMPGFQAGFLSGQDDIRKKIVQVLGMPDIAEIPV